MKYIPYGRQFIDKDDIKEVVKVLKSDWLTQGPMVQKFEESLAEYCVAKYAVAVSSGTAALHLACLASGLKKGDEAITSPVTFLATPNAILYTGAKPVFADIDYDTININPEEIKKNITRKTKAILPVHFAGFPCKMSEIAKLARKYSLTVIEDACHSLGAQYRSGRDWVRVGSCQHSDMTVFSFHPIKHITTGEGGAIITNSKKLYEKLKVLRNHGIYRDKKSIGRGSWFYEMRELGFNYRITDFQCALGLSQLKKVDGFIQRRREIASIYNAAFSGISGVEIPPTTSNLKHVYHLYVLKIDFKRFKSTRKELMLQLKKKGIFAQVNYIPICHQPFYRKNGFGQNQKFKMAEQYYRKALSIPIYPVMKDDDVRRVAGVLKGLMQ